MAEILRVVTLNLWGDHEPLAERLEAAAVGLFALAPDVVLLQEVRQGDGLPNTAHTLADRLGYQAAYACATRGEEGTFGPGKGAGEEGLAIISKHALSEIAARQLPDARPTERRILLSARLGLLGNAGDVYCHTTHLHWRPADGVARERQVEAIDDALLRMPEGALHILGGDFNSTPDSDEIRFLTGKHTAAGRRTCYQDAFTRVHPLDAGWTWTRRNPHTEWLSWLERDRRIDYLFVSPERRDGRGRVLSAQLVLDGPGPSGTWPSDHLGVAADISV